MSPILTTQEKQLIEYAVEIEFAEKVGGWIRRGTDELEWDSGGGFVRGIEDIQLLANDFGAIKNAIEEADMSWLREYNAERGDAFPLIFVCYPPIHPNRLGSDSAWMVCEWHLCRESETVSSEMALIRAALLCMEERSKKRFTKDLKEQRGYD